MSLRQKLILSGLPTGAGLLLVIFRWGTWTGHLGVALIVIGIVLDIVWIRCPKCGVWLGKYPGGHCSACGEKLDWNKRKRDC
ncbi:MAG: hypothetical protein ACOX7N_07105 [Lawsonibacter sp.]|jgi:hypothetical protein